MVNCGVPGGAAAQVKPGDFAVCFGAGGHPLKDAAALLGTAQSDLTCDLTRRTEKYYINPPSPLVGFLDNVEISQHLHPECLYGGQPVGSLPFPKGIKSRCVAEIDMGNIS